ncbi:PREDICTED: ethylene receptor 2 [Brassica oleracea var. oleracea]|uniref:Ethylene receptor n=1 Tax=Brassica oleracea var. oleracea TaxID=109376 RepID=A0A0D3ABB9_BRAOL|nr:PREDICTED: ethylene receptor 2 [Brassica oleracea var. oleracea]XP_013609414.1 PREDICTED: ethylene receptor 2 [Brassica oleracea var. oleracea]
MMVREVASGLLILFSILIWVSPAAAGNGGGCNCEDEGVSFWSTENILETQRVSDFLIAVAYFSIPIELLYFVSCSNVPFKWVLFEFIAFIVLCGMTHLLHGWTYGPHPFKLMVALTVFKMLTALVSCATAITLITLIPLLLKVKVREFMLKKKAHELGREVGLIMIQKETGVHVRMLTQEIRKSLDRHTILYTTLVELSKTLALQNCAVWMENEGKSEMNLTHELRGSSGRSGYGYSVSMHDVDVVRVRESNDVNILSVDSLIARASGGDVSEIGPVAAIRMPMLRVSDFKGGTPELIQTCYAILVCVLPSGQPRDWSYQEIEIVKVVADQVAVALSHAAVLEESQMMRDKLADQNRALQIAKRDAMRASQARNVLQKAMSEGMRRPMHSILGLLSMIQDEKLSNEQKMIVDTMVKTGNVMSNLVGDAMDVSDGRFVTEMKPFSLHRTVREAACLARCLCLYNGFRFTVDAEMSLPDNVVGDERRVFQVILHMVGSLVKPRKCREGSLSSSVIFKVFKERGSLDRSDQRWAAWRSPTCSADGDVYIRFEMSVENDGSGSQSFASVSSRDQEVGEVRLSGYGLGQDLSFDVCKKVVQLIQGNISVVPGSDGSPETMSLLLRFRRRPSISVHGTGEAPAPDHHLHPHSDSLLRGLQVLLVDTNDSNRAVTRKLLEKLGCIVTAVSSGFDCLTAIAPSSSSSSSTFQVVVLDLQMAEMDGYEVAMRIRSRSWPLMVAMTVSLDEEMWDKCMQIGINGVVRKPVMLRAMESELRRILLQADQLL